MGLGTEGTLGKLRGPLGVVGRMREPGLHIALEPPSLNIPIAKGTRVSTPSPHSTPEVTLNPKPCTYEMGPYNSGKFGSEAYQLTIAAST